MIVTLQNCNRRVVKQDILSNNAYFDQTKKFTHQRKWYTNKTGQNDPLLCHRKSNLRSRTWQLLENIALHCQDRALDHYLIVDICNSCLLINAMQKWNRIVVLLYPSWTSKCIYANKFWNEFLVEWNKASCSLFCNEQQYSLLLKEVNKHKKLPCGVRIRNF